MKWSLTVEEIVSLLKSGQVEGDFDGAISGIADLRRASAGELSFLGNKKFDKYLAETQASLVLVPLETESAPAENQAWIRVEDPSQALAGICAHIEKLILPKPVPEVHATAVIDPEASVDPSAYIGPHCVIEAGAEIGAKAILQSNVRVEHGAVVGEGTVLHHAVVVGWGCRIGRNCTLFPGAVLGADGFGFHSGSSGHKRIAQIGIVVIEDSVEVGANTAIDRARFAETRIGEGTKIDNLVQIGHNVTIGKHCIICALVGISGSAEFGNFVVLAGQVGVNGHIKIGDGVTATGQTGISKDVPAGMILSGTPGRDHRVEMRRNVMLNRLPALTERIKILEKNLCK